MGSIRDNLRDNLSYYLTINKISQKELADRLGVSQSAVTNWIKGKNSPDIEVVAQICQIFGVSINDLASPPESLPNRNSSPASSEDGTEEPTLQEDIDLLTNLFVARGYIKPGEDLSDRDAAILEKLIELLDLYFQGRN